MHARSRGRGSLASSSGCRGPHSLGALPGGVAGAGNAVVPKLKQAPLAGASLGLPVGKLANHVTFRGFNPPSFLALGAPGGGRGRGRGGEAGRFGTGGGGPWWAAWLVGQTGVSANERTCCPCTCRTPWSTQPRRLRSGRGERGGGD